ncbi:MAG: carboxypeptidase regulatory-like domain-containing protein, partial [Gemmatimonadetes bacterium]|nr:carboxypeptidase regulatory-like domain-containing protein [Gemmatimonadota bacterium]
MGRRSSTAALTLGLLASLAVPATGVAQGTPIPSVRDSVVIQGRVVDARTDGPIAEASVVVLDRALRPLAAGSTDATGRWRVTVAAETGEQVHVSASGFAAATLSLSPTDPTAIEVRLVRLGDSPPPAPLQVDGAAVASWCGEALDPTTAVVVGHVTDRRTGEGLAGVDAVAEWGGAEVPRLVVGGGTGPPYRAVRTGGDGLYLFCGLPADPDVRITVRIGGLPADTVRLALAEGTVHRADIGVELTVPGQPAGLFGTVVDEETREPVAGVRVEVSDGRRWALSNERGFFAVDSVPSGLQILRTRHLGYGDRDLPVVLEPGHTSEVRIGLATRAFELEPITVTVRSRSRLRDMQMFDHRRALGFGTFFTREDLERHRPWVLADLLRWTPGVQVRRSGAFG